MAEPMDIAIDWDRCMGSGNCLFWAPETFDLSEDGHAVVLDPAATDEDRLRVAAEGCPGRRDHVVDATAWPSSSVKGRHSAHRADGGTRGPAAHGPALAADALPAQRAPHRRRVGHRRAAGRLGEDGGPGLARPAPPRGRRRARLRPRRAGRGARRARLRPLPRPRALLRCWWPPSSPGTAARRSGQPSCPDWPTAPPRPAWRSGPACCNAVPTGTRSAAACDRCWGRPPPP